MSNIEEEFQQAWAEKTGEAPPGSDPDPLFNTPEPDGEPEPEPEPEAQPEAEPQGDGRVRDPDTGQFTTQERLEQKKWGGQFDTPEELENDYRTRLGSMANEIGQWRAWAQQQQQAQLQQQAQNVDEDPAQATVAALQAGDLAAYERNFKEWATEDPGNALWFAQQLMFGHVDTVVKSREQRTETVKSAMEAVRSEHPDFTSLEPQIARASELAPHLLAPLENGTVEQKKGVFEALYWIAKGMAGQPPTAPPGAPPPQQPGQHPLAERLAGYVASPTSGGAPQGEQMNPHQRESALLREMFDRGVEEMSR